MLHYSLTTEFARFRWEHPCFLSTNTLSVVLRLQGTSLRSLSFGEYTGTLTLVELAELKNGGLTVLDMAELRVSLNWPMELLARNYRTLRHLRLGTEIDLVYAYTRDGHVAIDEYNRFTKTRRLVEFLKERMADLKDPSTPVVQLESFSIIGLDLLPFAANGSTKPVIDFNSLSVLTIESCSGLLQALRTLMNSGAGSGKAKNALGLHTLKIRHENTSDELLVRLKLFLLSLRPLTHLHVLLEGLYDQSVFRMDKVLQVHGTCLRSLVWDGRTGPRNDTGSDTACCGNSYENLGLIAHYCPGLRALGISIPWNFTESDEYWVRVAVAVPGCTLDFLLISLSLLVHSLS